jgi:hypothetical protein
MERRVWGGCGIKTKLYMLQDNYGFIIRPLLLIYDPESFLGLFHGMQSSGFSTYRKFQDLVNTETNKNKLRGP